MKRRPLRKSSASQDSGAAKTPQSVPPAPYKPFKPRPMLFALLMGVFVVWLGILLVLFFSTKPAPMPSPSTEPVARQNT